MTPTHPATPPANPLAARPGRLFVVRARNCELYAGRDAGNNFHHFTGVIHEARKFSTVGDAASWIGAYENLWMVVAYDDPASTDAWLAEMRQGAKDAERVKWVAGERNGHAVEAAR